MPRVGPERPRRKPAAASTRRPYPVLTLRETLIFPLTTFPLAVGREASLRAVEEASRGARQLVLLAQKQSETEEPLAADLYTAGTLARVRHVVRSTDGTQQVWVQGLERVRVVEFLDADGAKQTAPKIPSRDAIRTERWTIASTTRSAASSGDSVGTLS